MRKISMQAYFRPVACMDGTDNDYADSGGKNLCCCFYGRRDMRILVKANNLTREEWLKWRTKGIGGSDSVVGRVKEIAAYIGDLESTTEKYYIAIRKKTRIGGLF